MNNKIILLDVDGVLADFTSAALRIGNELTGMHVTPTDVKEWDLFNCFPSKYRGDLCSAIETEGFCEGLCVYPGAFDGVTKLRELGSVYAVTSPWGSKTWCWERAFWLNNHFGFHPDHVVHTASKYLVRGDVLLDDKPENLMQWHAVNRGLCLLMDAPYNKYCFSKVGDWSSWSRVRNWDEIVSAAKGHLDG